MIGTGGFAAELTDYIESNLLASNLSDQLEILGYFDFNAVNHDHYGFKAPYLGRESEYSFSENDRVIIAIGDLEKRASLVLYFKKAGVIIEGFIHHTAMISKSAKLGVGNIISPYVIVGPKAQLGSHNFLNFHCFVAHDCEIGSGNILSPNIQITGHTQVGDFNFFGVSSGTKPLLKIGNFNKIQAGIIVDKNISDNSIVFNLEKIKKRIMFQ